MSSECPRSRTSTSDPRVIVVLGAAVWLGGVPSPTLERRCHAAALLWAEGHHDIVIPSGGLGLHPPAEAVVMANLLAHDGVPDSAIEVEAQARSTMETARLVSAMLPPGAGITVVSDTYHLARTWLAFRAHGRNVRVHGAWKGNPPPRLKVMAKAWARESAGLVVYAWRILRGRI